MQLNGSYRHLKVIMFLRACLDQKYMISTFLQVFYSKTGQKSQAYLKWSKKIQPTSLFSDRTEIFRYSLIHETVQWEPDLTFLSSFQIKKKRWLCSSFRFWAKNKSKSDISLKLRYLKYGSKSKTKKSWLRSKKNIRWFLWISS